MEIEKYLSYLSCNNTKTHASLPFVERDVYDIRSLGKKLGQTQH